MSEEIEVLKIITSRLNDAEIPYMVSGSVAANYYTIPRMTRDIDLVIELKQDDIDKFVNLFKDDFYVNREMVANEVSRQGMFNRICLAGQSAFLAMKKPFSCMKRTN